MIDLENMIGRILEENNISIKKGALSESYVLDFSEHDKPLYDKIQLLQDEYTALYKRFIKTKREHQEEMEKMNRLVSDLYNKAQKNNKNYEIIVAREINGVKYVRFEDFNAVVSRLQAHTDVWNC